MIPHLTLAWWLFGFSIILCIWLFEASFRKTRRLEKIASFRLKSDISLTLVREAVYEILDDADTGHRLPNTIGFYIRVINEGDKFLEKCQITFGEKNAFVVYPVSGYFDLRPGEYKNITVIRISCEGKIRHPFVYMKISNDGKISSGAGCWLLDPDKVFEIKAFSANTNPVSMPVQLTYIDGKWGLTECG
jgi:hypothetical protein